MSKAVGGGGGDEGQEDKGTGTVREEEMSELNFRRGEISLERCVSLCVYVLDYCT